jgi:hypothetical protein
LHRDITDDLFAPTALHTTSFSASIPEGELLEEDGPLLTPEEEEFELLRRSALALAEPQPEVLKPQERGQMEGKQEEQLYPDLHVNRPSAPDFQIPGGLNTLESLQQEQKKLSDQLSKVLGERKKGNSSMESVQVEFELKKAIQLIEEKKQRMSKRNTNV